MTRIRPILPQPVRRPCLAWQGHATHAVLHPPTT